MYANPSTFNLVVSVMLEYVKVLKLLLLILTQLLVSIFNVGMVVYIGISLC